MRAIRQTLDRLIQLRSLPPAHAPAKPELFTASVLDRNCRYGGRSTKPSSAAVAGGARLGGGALADDQML